MRIGALIRSYGLTTYLKPVIKQYDWIDRVLVLNHIFKGVKPREDTTLTCIAEVNQPNVVVDKGLGNQSQHDVFNRGIELLKDCDLIFISDADELISRVDQTKLIIGMEGYDLGVCRVIDYAKDLNHRYPIRTHRPPVITRPTTRFHDVRCYMGGAKYFDNVFMHHLGYVYTPDEIKWKLEWEKIYEGDSVSDLLCRTHEPYEMPENIKELLDESVSPILL